MKKTKLFMLGALILSLALFPLAADKAQANEKQWEFEFTPYVWLPSLDVDSTVSGLTANLNLSFGDVADNFDLYSLMGRFEAWRGNKWGLILDGMYLKMKNQGSMRTKSPLQVAVDMETRQELVDIGVAYRFEHKLKGTSALQFDPYVTVRYTYLKQEIKLRASAGSFGGPGTLLGGNESWFDPIVGLRVAYIINPTWSLGARGEVGGFGVGSELTWSALAGADWRVASWGSLKLGYKWYYLDYKTGSGRNAFGFDGTMHGPWLGFTFHF